MISEIRYEVETLFFERFLENALEQGFRLFSVEKTGGKTHAFSVAARGHRRFALFLRQYAIPCRIVQKRGAPCAAAFLKAHPALAALAVLALWAVYALSGRIWIIEADGQMAEALSGLGVSRGVKKALLNESAISRQLCALFPDCSFVGVSVRGVALTVNAEYKPSPPELFSLSAGGDLISCADGIVEKVLVQAGSAVVKPGDTVKKGDILIKGEERSGKDGQTAPVRARGTVTARVWTQAEASVAPIRTEKRYTGNFAMVTQLKTPFFSRRLAGENPFEAFDCETEAACVIGLFLPVTVEKTLYREYETRTSPVEAEEAARAARAAAFARARLSMHSNAREADRWISVSASGNGIVRAEAVIEWIQEIAEEQGG